MVAASLSQVEPTEIKQDEDKKLINEVSSKFERGEQRSGFNIRRTSRQHNRIASELSHRKKELLAKTITDIKVVPLYHEHVLD